MSDETKKPGRPRVHSDQENPMDAYQARMTAWHARQARKLGEGNLSAGIRFCIEYVTRNRGIDEPAD